MLYIAVLFIHRFFAIESFLVISLITAVCYQVLKDYFSSIRLRHSDRLAILCAYLIIPVQVYLAITFSAQNSLIIIPLFILAGMPLFMIMGQRMYGFLSAGSLSGDKQNNPRWHRLIHSLILIQWGMVAVVYTVTQITILWVMPTEANLIYVGVAFFGYLIGFEWLNRRIGIWG